MNIHRLYRPFLLHFRRRRMRLFKRAFRLLNTTRVLDVGGTGFNWGLVDVRPRLVLLNLEAKGRTAQESDWVVADARHLPFASHTYDIVFSNSVIEHLGTWECQARMAEECRRVGRRYFVQTPNMGFPLEPHLLTPFFHWLPYAIQERLIRGFTLWAWITRPSREECQRFLEETRLLRDADMRRLFPDAEIWKERFMGMTKSLIAVRTVPWT